MQRYVVLIARTGDGYAATVPDLPGCAAVAPTIWETENAIREAIQFYLDGLRDEDRPIPEAKTVVAYVEA